jgi:adenylosuccinate synthase
VGYKLDGVESNRLPMGSEALNRVEPVYAYLQGWECCTEGISRFEDLPENAAKYIQFLEERIGVAIKIISTSPHRDHTIFRESM